MTLTDRCRISTRQETAQRGELRHIMPLKHGGIAGFNLGYELVGPSGAPLLLIAGGISAGRHVLATQSFPEPGWWQAQAGSLGEYRVLAIDWIGADGVVDLAIDPLDQAEAIAWLLDELDEPAAHGFIGASYGAMVGMHFAARFPAKVGALLAISASDRPHPYASACRALQRKATLLGDPAAGVALARALAILTYRTPEEFKERFNEAPKVIGGRVRVAAEPYLDLQGERHCQRMGGIAYRRLSESIDLHRIDAAAIQAPLTLVAVDNDALVPAAEIEALAARVPGAHLHLIKSTFGHDAFLKEEAQIGTIISQFLTLSENQQ